MEILVGRYLAYKLKAKISVTSVLNEKELKMHRTTCKGILDALNYISRDQKHCSLNNKRAIVLRIKLQRVKMLASVSINFSRRNSVESVLDSEYQVQCNTSSHVEVVAQAMRKVDLWRWGGGMEQVRAHPHRKITSYELKISSVCRYRCRASRELR